MKISVLTPAHNAESTLEQCVKMVSAMDFAGEIEQIIIDDGSTDGTPQLAEQLALQYPFVTVIKKVAGGEASALNAGLKITGGDYIAILEADVEPARNWLSELLPLFSDSKVMGVGGYLKTPPGDSWIARIAGYEIEEKMRYKPANTVHITSANALYRREAFEIAGDFREELVNASLDADFNYRLVDKGFKLIFYPRASVFHHYKVSLGEFLARQFAYARYRVYLKAGELYPADKWVGVEAGLAGLLCLSCCVIPWGWYWPLPILFLMLLIPGVSAVGLYARYRDKVLLAYPLVFTLRAFVHLAGICLGGIAKVLGWDRAKK